MSSVRKKRKDHPLDHQPSNLFKFFSPNPDHIKPPKGKRQKKGHVIKPVQEGRTPKDAIIVQDSDEDDDEFGHTINRALYPRDQIAQGQQLKYSGLEILEIGRVINRAGIVTCGSSSTQLEQAHHLGVDLCTDGDDSLPSRGEQPWETSTPHPDRAHSICLSSTEEEQSGNYDDQSMSRGMGVCTGHYNTDNAEWTKRRDKYICETNMARNVICTCTDPCGACLSCSEGVETRNLDVVHVNSCSNVLVGLRGQLLTTTQSPTTPPPSPPHPPTRLPVTPSPRLPPSPATQFAASTHKAPKPMLVESHGPTTSHRLKPANNNAFTLLMSTDKQDERIVWAEAQAAENRDFRPTKENGGRRKAPFYKVMQGMPIAVDAFRYGAIPDVKAYFLTHAHSDHYTNLASNWRHGPIYCSETTARLIVHMLSVDKRWVRPLPMDTPTEIPNTGGVTVTLIDANHCPGSCILLFEGRQTVNAGDSSFKSRYVGSPRVFRYLHCGDFRAHPKHVLHPAIKGKKIDDVYLDTTYADPKYCFPPQPLVVKACAELARRVVNGEPMDAIDADGTSSKPLTMTSWLQSARSSNKGKGRAFFASTPSTSDILVVVGTYSIGKERTVKAIANALSSRVYCDSRKTAILECQSDPELRSLLTRDPHSACVHIVPLGMVNADGMKAYLERWKGAWKRLIAFRPTGWTYKAPPGTATPLSISSLITRSQQQSFEHTQLSPTRASSSAVTIYGVPYSEHSSFLELSCFALSLDWMRMIATVNVGSERGRDKINGWIEKWKAEGNKRRQAGHSRVVEYRSEDYW